jgi:L-lysine exporter family protein LysE/ArgO
VDELWKYFLQGFLLGAAYVAPIGMQNLYVINTAINKRRLRAYQTAAITIFFDVSLAMACFFGIGVLLDRFQVLNRILLILGSLAVLYIGINLIRSKPELKNDVKIEETLAKVAAICFAVTWLNPQAIIDGSMILGGFRASLPQSGAIFFISGVAFASFTWFTALTTVVSIFKHIISKKVLRMINVICGGIIIFFGIKLVLSLLLQ